MFVSSKSPPPPYLSTYISTLKGQDTALDDDNLTVNKAHNSGGRQEAETGRSAFEASLVYTLKTCLKKPNKNNLLKRLKKKEKKNSQIINY